MRQSQYIASYRGEGNYSVRLYEPMASGRLPIVVICDNLLPYPEEIGWHMFPVIEENNIGNIAQSVASFHASLSNDQYIQLQKEAKKISKEYLTQKRFLVRFFKNYI